MRKPNIIELFLTIILVLIVFCSFIVQLLFRLESGASSDFSVYYFTIDNNHRNEVDRLYDELMVIAERENCMINLVAHQKSDSTPILIGTKLNRVIGLDDIETLYLPYKSDDYALIFRVDIDMKPIYEKYDYDFEKHNLYLDNGDSIVITGETSYFSKESFKDFSGMPVPVVYVAENMWSELDSRLDVTAIEVYSEHELKESVMEEIDRVLSPFTIKSYDTRLFGPDYRRDMKIVDLISKVIEVVLLVLSSGIVFQYFSLLRRKNKIQIINASKIFLIGSRHASNSLLNLLSKVL